LVGGVLGGFTSKGSTVVWEAGGRAVVEGAYLAPGSGVKRRAGAAVPSGLKEFFSTFCSGT
jgi:hypothetical protein